ncbi:hypothetical protein ACQJBY_001658 [Aegilops geniculata]
MSLCTSDAITYWSEEEGRNVFFTLFNLRPSLYIVVLAAARAVRRREARVARALLLPARPRRVEAPPMALLPFPFLRTCKMQHEATKARPDTEEARWHGCWSATPGSIEATNHFSSSLRGGPSRRWRLLPSPSFLEVAEMQSFFDGGAVE